MNLDEAWTAYEQSVKRTEESLENLKVQHVLQHQCAHELHEKAEALALAKTELIDSQRAVVAALGPLETALSAHHHYYQNNGPAPDVDAARAQFAFASEACRVGGRVCRALEIDIKDLERKLSEVNKAITELEEAHVGRVAGVGAATERLTALLRSAVAGICPKLPPEVPESAAIERDSAAARTRSTTPHVGGQAP